MHTYINKHNIYYSRHAHICQHAYICAHTDADEFPGDFPPGERPPVIPPVNPRKNHQGESPGEITRGESPRPHAHIRIHLHARWMHTYIHGGSVKSKPKKCLCHKYVMRDRIILKLSRNLDNSTKNIIPTHCNIL